MPVYISILRGINVGGQKIIKMDALRNSYESSGFSNVTTYVQSGNVIFTADKSDTAVLEQNIARRIRQDFGFDVPVIVLTIDKLKRIVNANPFFNDPGKDPSFLHVTFLSSKPAAFDKQTVETKIQPGEAIAYSDTAVYLYCPNGYGRTKLSNSFLETKMKVGATTRNWKTTVELLRMAEVAAKER